MGSLWLSTLAMMGLTFAIGFVVAGVIWLIAYWAGSFEFYSLHQDELKRLKRIRRFQRRGASGWGFFAPLRKDDVDYDLSSYYQGVNDNPGEDPQDADKFYHETSLGVSDLGLMDFYYPSDAKIAILEHQQEDAEARQNGQPEKLKR